MVAYYAAFLFGKTREEEDTRLREQSELPGNDWRRADKPPTPLSQAKTTIGDNNGRCLFGFAYFAIAVIGAIAPIVSKVAQCLGSTCS